MFSFLQPKNKNQAPEKAKAVARAGPAPWWPGPETRVQRLSANPVGRDFVVGDLHGCLEPLGRLLAHVKFHQGRDRLFCVGDLVDRGPESMSCLRLLEMPWFHGVLGNHEQMLIRHLEDPFGVKAYDEGWVLGQAHKFSERSKFAAVWLPKLKRLPLVMLVGRGRDLFGVVHAEIIEQGTSVSGRMIESWGFADPARAMRSAVGGRRLIRSWRDGRRVTGAHDPSFPTVYCGHTIVPEPMQVAGQVYIDTGAFLGHDPGRAPLRARPAQAADREEVVLTREPALTLVLAGTQQAWMAPTRSTSVQEVVVSNSAKR